VNLFRSVPITISGLPGSCLKFLPAWRSSVGIHPCRGRAPSQS
jgi:hypothetical protein